MEFKIKLKSKMDEYHDMIITDKFLETRFKLEYIGDGTYSAYKIAENNDLELVNSDLSYKHLTELIREFGYSVVKE